LTWPESFIFNACDEKKVRYGDKTTTLEPIGMLVPMLLAPGLFKNSHVVIKVDCFGSIYGMEKGFCKGDISASIFIRAIFLISSYLNCTLHTVHLPRMSDWGAQVADRLSRNVSSTRQDKKLVGAFHNRQIPKCLEDWFLSPCEDWDLSKKLLDHVKRLV
jgi:hypothetical protein